MRRRENGKKRRSTQCSGRGEAGPVISSEEATGERHERPACPMCSRTGALPKAQRTVIIKALDAHTVFDLYFESIKNCLAPVDYWDYQPQYPGLEQTSEGAAMGRTLDEMDVEERRIIRGSLHVALAAGVLDESERREAVKVFDRLDRYSLHRRLMHGDGHETDCKKTSLGRTCIPESSGDCDLARIWRLAPEVQGKTIEEIRMLLIAKCQTLLKALKASDACVVEDRVEILCSGDLCKSLE